MHYVKVGAGHAAKRRQWSSGTLAGGDDAEVTPVPMPNTEVKLCSADDTWREAAWESRKPPAMNEERQSKRTVFFRCNVPLHP